MTPEPRPEPHERRRNVALRETLDEVLQLARHLSNHAASMSPQDLSYARERLEWLVDEIWTLATTDASSP